MASGQADELSLIWQQIDTLHATVAALIEVQRLLLVSQRSPQSEQLLGRLDELRGQLQPLRRAIAGRIEADGAPPVARPITRLEVQRIDVREPDGTPRLTISNKMSAPDPVIGGKATTRQGGNQAGLIFFNELGDECGGLIWGAEPEGEVQRANAAMLFDQFQGDQTVGITYDQEDGRRWAGFNVWDRPDAPLSELMERYETLKALEPGPERDQAEQELRAEGLIGAQRVFVGKTAEKEAIVDLRDGRGTPRLRLIVSEQGEAQIAFLDERGEITRTLPEQLATPAATET